MSKDQLDEIIESNAAQLLDVFKSYNGKIFDPHEIFRAATLNIVTQFAVGKKYELEHPDFKVLCHTMDLIMNNIDSRIISKALHVRLILVNRLQYLINVFII